MPKVRCRNCRHFMLSPRKRRDNRYIYEKYIYKGHCMSDKCAEFTSGYTGDPRGQKMTRNADSERFCKFFEPLTEKQLEKLRLEEEEKRRNHQKWLDSLPECIICDKKDVGHFMVGPKQKGPFCYDCYEEYGFEALSKWKDCDDEGKQDG